MPTYDYRCDRCGSIIACRVRYEDREAVMFCDCGGTLEYQFPVQAALGYRPFEAFYCEPFGCDVRSRGEWAEILRSKGLVEKGERAGLRLEEKSKHAVRIGPQKPRGITYADVQRKADTDNGMKAEIDRITGFTTTGREA
jgi:hypothetical protein